ncbi:MAG: M16 family metallopeptidase [Phycisphaerae bacterium]
MSSVEHGKLPCGIEYGIVPLATRHIVAMQFRVLTGVADEPAGKAGLARLVEQTIDMGTEKHSARELSDAFDAIGASSGSYAGRETTTFTCTTLPEHFEEAVNLHAEMLRTPTFPDENLKVNVDLSLQELSALEDDPQSLTDRLISTLAYGSILGRHPLGDRETLSSTTRDDLVHYWKNQFHAGRMIVSVAGAIEPARVKECLETAFAGFGSAESAGRNPHPVTFSPGINHENKDTEQQQIALCWPGLDATHELFPAQQLTLGILSGGMSGRLFTEVREKLALCYWVSAWQETPRGSGMIFMGASTTPERCHETYDALLREVDRLAHNLTAEELDRAVTGILAQRETRGESTRAKCSEIASDLFFYGRPIPVEEKTAKIRGVDLDQIAHYLATVPRDQLCVVTLGPRAMETATNGISQS